MLPLSASRQTTLRLIACAVIGSLSQTTQGEPLFSVPLPAPLKADEAIYCCTYVFSPSAQPCFLALGAASPHKVWINGTLAASVRTRAGKPLPAASLISAALRKGPNFILLKFCGPGKPAFYFKILDQDAAPLEALAFRRPRLPGERVDSLSWAYIGPFSCPIRGAALDTRFLVECRLQGPPQDVSCLQGWTPLRRTRPRVASRFVNGGFEFVDDAGRPCAWRAVWGEATAPVGPAFAGRRALSLPASPRPVSREILSYPFKIDARRAVRAGFRYRLSKGEASGLPGARAVDVWLQWLDSRGRVIAADFVAGAPEDEKADGWRAPADRVLHPPFGAACARFQIKTRLSRRGALVDDISFETLPDE